MITNLTAGVVSRHDYMPFGEELGAPVGGRTTGMGFSVADGHRKKFTGYEADNETSLDYAQARYYASTQGRFTSADSYAGSSESPQTLNLYSYVKGNPLRFKDPTGHYSMPGTTPDPCAGQPLCSTHTDASGTVVAVYNDKDPGVYRHADLSKWNRKSKLPNKGNGVSLEGITEYWDEFAKVDSNGKSMEEPAENARIDFKSDWDETFWPLVARADEMPAWEVARESGNGGMFDIKSHLNLAPYGHYTGKGFRYVGGLVGTRVFFSAKSIGNFLAGFNGARTSFLGAHIDELTMMNLAGSLQQKQFKGTGTLYDIVVHGKTFGPPPYYGETEYAGRRIHQGFVRGVQSQP